MLESFKEIPLCFKQNCQRRPKGDRYKTMEIETIQRQKGNKGKNYNLITNPDSASYMVRHIVDVANKSTSKMYAKVHRSRIADNQILVPEAEQYTIISKIKTGYSQTYTQKRTKM